MHKLYLIICMFFTLHICAQRIVVSDKNIHTVQCIANNDWSAMPVIGLGDDTQVSISFDELSHDFHKYHYIIRHCNRDWKPSGMLESEYLNGFNDQTIDDFTQSMNTTTIFNHYTITLPNDDVQFKVSGNYKIIFFEDEKSEEEPSFTVPVYVVDRKVVASAEISGNTEINNRTTSQQLTISMNLASLNVRDVKTELTTKVMQNRRPETVRTVQPSYITSDILKFEHNRDLIFNGFNEYRRFEVTNSINGTMGVDYIRWNKQTEQYDVHLFADEPRPNYSYDEDHNGLFYIRNDSRQDIDTESDYMLVHFKLQCDPMPTERVFINGALSNNGFTPEYEMHYNINTHCYEQNVLLKQGQYDYQYTGLNGKVLPIEGNFYETRNEYEMFVYYHPFGSRYDQLVGMSIFK